jgi:hypothetical protein
MKIRVESGEVSSPARILGAGGQQHKETNLFKADDIIVSLLQVFTYYHIMIISKY